MTGRVFMATRGMVIIVSALAITLSALFGSCFAGAAIPKYIMTSYKVSYASDSVRINLYFNESVEAKRIGADGGDECAVEFDLCDIPGGPVSQKLGDSLVESVRIYREEGRTIARAKLSKPTHTRLMKGRDHGRFYISMVIYRPYESYAKYKARVAEIERYRSMKIPIVVIDPGHGGKDSGAPTSGGGHEKSLNFRYARKIAEYINETGLCRAYLTRYGDDFLSLSRRVFIANLYSADAFVSIHFNANRSKKVRGFEAYYLSSGATSDKSAQAIAEIENSSEVFDEAITGEEDLQVQSILLDLREKENIKESGILSEIITRSVGEIKRYSSNRANQANFAVLRNLMMPSVLLEIGYITNRGDMDFLSVNDNFEEVCSRVAIGIITYLCDRDPGSSAESAAPAAKKASVAEKLRRINDGPSRSSDGDGVSGPVSEVATAPPAAKKKPVAGSVDYKVRRGDTLSKIARKHKVGVNAIIEANPGFSSSTTIHPGDVLKVPAGASR